MKVLAILLLLPFLSQSQKLYHGTLIAVHHSDTALVIGADSKASVRNYHLGVISDSIVTVEKTFQSGNKHFALAGYWTDSMFKYIDSCCRNTKTVQDAARLLISDYTPFLIEQVRIIRQDDSAYYLSHFKKNNPVMELVIYGIDNKKPQVAQLLFLLNNNPRDSIQIYSGWFPVFNTVCAIGAVNMGYFDYCASEISSRRMKPEAAILDFLERSSLQFKSIGPPYKVVTMRSDGSETIYVPVEPRKIELN